MAGNPTAQSGRVWHMSGDGRVYDFTLPKSVKFYLGETLTSEDVKLRAK